MEVFVVISCFLQISRTGKHTAFNFPLLPTLLSATDDEKLLLAGQLDDIADGVTDDVSCDWAVKSADCSSSAGSDKCLSLFSIDRNSVDRILDLQHDDSVLCACISSDGRLLASGSADQLLRVGPAWTRQVFSGRSQT